MYYCYVMRANADYLQQIWDNEAFYKERASERETEGVTQ